MALSDLAIKRAKPSEKAVKMFDGGGLFLQVEPTGGKLWCFKYRFERKEKLLALGSYPPFRLERQGRGAWMQRSCWRKG